MSLREKEAIHDVVVVGGGIAGTCATTAVARESTSIATVQNRSVFGGTVNSETRIHIMGANCRSSKSDLRETGTLEGILFESEWRSPYAALPVSDMILWEKAFLEGGATAYLNTNMDDTVPGEGRIRGIVCHQSSMETQFMLCRTLFTDATGRGMLGVVAGTALRVGSKVRAEFQEPTVPETVNQDTMGNMVMSLAVDRGEPVRFEEPAWACIYTKENPKYRLHVDEVCAQADGGGTVAPEEGKSQSPEFSNVDAGYWWIELSGNYSDTTE